MDIFKEKMFAISESILNIIKYELFAEVAVKNEIVVSAGHWRLDVDFMLWNYLHVALGF